MIPNIVNEIVRLLALAHFFTLRSGVSIRYNARPSFCRIYCSCRGYRYVETAS